MVDTTLAGSGTLGSYTPVQLFAGEQDVVTDRAMVKINISLDQYEVIALDGDGQIVAWDPESSGVGADYARGTLTIANAVPVAGDKFTINGVDIIFRAAADPDLNEVTIGGTITATMVNLKNFINDHLDTLEVSAVSANVGVVTVRANVPGVDGNAITLAKTFATGANGSVSGATLASGNTSEGTAVGIMLHAVDTTAGGLNKSVYAPYYSGGFFNHEALVWPDSIASLVARKAAFLGTNISIGKVL